MFRRFLTWLAVALVAFTGRAVGAEDFLKADEAFRVSADREADRILVKWDIAPDYYLYRSKFRFTSETPGIELGRPEYPAAAIKEDPFFGEMEVYRDSVTVSVPVTSTAARETVTLEATSQGCADAGLCYPPHRQTLLVALGPPQDAIAATQHADGPGATEAGAMPPAAEESASPGSAVAELSTFADQLGLGGFDDDILSAEEAFHFSAVVDDSDTLRLRWDIAEGTYLYADKIGLTLAGDGVELGQYALPPPKVKHDLVTPEGDIGDVEVYLDAIDIEVSLVRRVTDATGISLTASYQGCAERGICYPPQKTTVDLELPPGDLTPAAAEAGWRGVTDYTFPGRVRGRTRVVVGRLACTLYASRCA